MINLNSLKCRCGCQSHQEIQVNQWLLETLKYIDQKYGLKPDSILRGYSCINQVHILASMAEKGLANKPAKHSLHEVLPLQAVDMAHKVIKQIFKDMDDRHPNDYGLGLYDNIGGGISIHLDVREQHIRWVCVKGAYIYSHTDKEQYDKEVERILH